MTFAHRHHPVTHLSGMATCLLALITLLLLPVAGWSAGMKAGGPTPEQIVSAMRERLNLTQEQEAQIYPIMEQYQQKKEGIFQKYRGKKGEAKEAIRSELEALREDIDGQLRTILSKEQMEEYQKMREERREKMRQQRQEKMGKRGSCKVAG